MSKEWIRSEGGPLILLEERLRPSWNGVLPVEGVVNSDYQRACGVADYVGLIPVGSGVGIVLGEEPIPATWVSSMPHLGYGALVRSYYDEFNPGIWSSLNDVKPEIFVDPTLTVELRDSRLVLFDSGEPGSNVLGDELAISIEPGEYRISTGEYRPNQEILLWIHRFERK
jgi:hypothetical protein